MRFLPAQDEYGRWAVQDTNAPPYLFALRYVDEASAQSFCDIQNAVERGCATPEHDGLWVEHRKVRQFAPLLKRVEHE